jgi:GTP cyclohydrolase I
MKILTWNDISRLAAVAGKEIPRESKLYGIPRGGCHAAQAISAQYPSLALTDSPEEADFVVDDLVDSGKTRSEYASRYPGKPFICLLDKSQRKCPTEWIQFPWEAGEPSGAEDGVRRLLQRLGENPDREGLLETPARFIKAMLEFTSGLKEDPTIHLEKDFSLDDTAPVQYGGMIISAGIPFVSLCEHHLLPFSGECHIGYVPSLARKRVVGLSKLARLADGYARRPQVQERLTQQIADALRKLDPAGIMVVVSAKHTCQCLRGVRKDGRMVTSSVYGIFEEAAARAEFLSLAGVKTS